MAKKKVVKKRKPKAIVRSLPQFEFPVGFWRNNWFPALLLFALAIGLYIQTVNFEYVLDDQIVFTKNDFSKKGFAGIWEILTTESMQGYFGEQKNLVEGNRYRPLSIVTFAMEHQFFGLNSWVSHFINVLMYAFTGILLYYILYLIFPPKEEERWYFSLAFLASLLFVLHPIHSEVVANVKGRDEIMTLIGCLLTLYVALRYVAKGNPVWLILSAIVFFFALLAKENALTFIAVIPITLYCFTKASYQRIGLVFGTLLGIFIFWIMMRTYLGIPLFDGRPPSTDLMNNPFLDMDVGEKFATIFYTLGLYVKLLIFPDALTHDYYPYHIPIMNWGKMGSLLSLVLYVAMGLYALVRIWKKDIIAYGITFYLATLSITSNIPFTVGTFMNERFVYISSIGFVIILAYLLKEKIPQWIPVNVKGVNPVSMTIIALFVAGFIYKTIDRVPAWRNPLTLNKAAIKISKNSARANCFTGTALFNVYKDEKDAARRDELLEEIAGYINKSVSIYPEYFSGLTMKSGVLAEEFKRDRDIDKLLNGFHDILRNKPNGIGFIDEYLEYLIGRDQESLKVADFCYRTGYEFYAKERRDYPRALKYLNFGLQAVPNEARMNFHMGKVYELAGNSDKAQPYLDKAYMLDPSLR